MDSPQSNKPPLNELIYGLFYDVFKKAAHIPFSIDQLNSLRQTTDKICKVLQDEVKDKIKRLAAITVQEMKEMEARLTNKRLTDGSQNTEETRDS